MSETEFQLLLWALRIVFLLLLYLFLLAVVLLLQRSLKASSSSDSPVPGRLVVLSPGETKLEAGQSLSLRALNTIGREVNNSIVLDDSFVSSQHALLVYRQGRWVLEDQGSTNGTYLNDQLLSGSAAIDYGDEIGIGQVKLRLMK